MYKHGYIIPVSETMFYLIAKYFSSYITSDRTHTLALFYTYFADRIY